MCRMYQEGKNVLQESKDNNEPSDVMGEVRSDMMR
jgi:hypothetical protein